MVTEPFDLRSAALAALLPPGVAIERAAETVPSVPGLYAVHGSASTWRALGLGDPPDERPLYVGKAEKSLASRDVRTHFSTGKTGSSTLRRSVAALLRDELDLVACPRNVSKPGHFANFGLEPASDERVSKWMLELLFLTTWSSPAGTVLDEVETAVLAVLRPPLNLAKVDTPWRRGLKAARSRMAGEARGWQSAERCR